MTQYDTCSSALADFEDDLRSLTEVSVGLFATSDGSLPSLYYHKIFSAYPTWADEGEDYAWDFFIEYIFDGVLCEIYELDEFLAKNIKTYMNFHLMSELPGLLDCICPDLEFSFYKPSMYVNSSDLLWKFKFKESLYIGGVSETRVLPTLD